MSAGEWGSFLGVPAETSVLAFITTIHCALTVLRQHRPRGTPALVMFPSIVFAVSPWFLSTPFWLFIGLASHVAWFIACEKLIPATAAKKRPLTAPRSGGSAAPVPQPAAPPAAQRGFQRLPVLAVIPETAEIRTFRFARPEGFSYRPGQFVMVKVEMDGKPAVRCYSISSSPSASGFIEISVRNQGRVSGFLHASLRPGMALEVNSPRGTFVYPEGSRPIVLIAGGIGITPFLSMLRHALESEPDRSVTLVVSAKTEAMMPFLNELRLRAARHTLFTLVVALSQGSDKKEFFSGRIDGKLIEAVIDRPQEAVFLICGPLPMIDGTRKILQALGVPEAQVRSERFEAAVANAGVAAHVPVAAAAPEPGNGLCVRLRRRGRTVTMRDGQSILEAAESAGEEFPSMCRAGVCGTCLTLLVEGQVDGDFDAVDPAERAKGYVLACVARPTTDCVVDA